MAAIVEGWWQSATRRDSPNADERPAGADIELVVIHNISLPAGEFGGPSIDNLFMNCLDCEVHPDFTDLEGLEVSAHLLIRRDGQAIQYVPYQRRAWHAGQSDYCGRQRCNDFSIGIEMEGSDATPFTDAQYETLNGAIRVILNNYPTIAPTAIVGHSDIAPGRKTDPGPCFDWTRLRTDVANMNTVSAQ